MMLRRLGVAAVAAALSFSVAAKKPELPMPLADDLAVEVVLSQHELAVDVPETASSMGMQFGLVGALVGSAVQNAQVKKAEERIVPIRDHLLGYRFNERIEAVLRTELPSEGISPNPSIRVMQTPWDAVEARNGLGDMPLYAMVIVPRYSMDSGFGTLSVMLNVQVVDRTIKSNGKVKTKRRLVRDYAYRFPLLDTVDAGPQVWARMGPERLAQLLDRGIEQSVEMLVHDLSEAGRTEQRQVIRGERVHVKGLSYPGRAMRQTEDHVWVRTGNGRMSKLSGYQPISADVAMAQAVAPMEEAASVVSESVAADESALEPGKIESGAVGTEAVDTETVGGGEPAADTVPVPVDEAPVDAEAVAPAESTEG